jgi:hypothetical protein
MKAAKIAKISKTAKGEGDWVSPMRGRAHRDPQRTSVGRVAHTQVRSHPREHRADATLRYARPFASHTMCKFGLGSRTPKNCSRGPVVHLALLGRGESLAVLEILASFWQRFRK